MRVQLRKNSDGDFTVILGDSKRQLLLLFSREAIGDNSALPLEAPVMFTLDLSRIQRFNRKHLRFL